MLSRQQAQSFKMLAKYLGVSVYVSGCVLRIGFKHPSIIYIHQAEYINTDIRNNIIVYLDKSDAASSQ